VTVRGVYVTVGCSTATDMYSHALDGRWDLLLRSARPTVSATTPGAGWPPRVGLIRHLDRVVA